MGTAPLRRIPLLALVTLLAATQPALAHAAPPACSTGRVILAPPPPGRTYLAAFPDLSDHARGRNEDAVSAARVRAFERLSGRRLAWVEFSDHWIGGRIAFPARAVRAIVADGRLPYIRLMPWSREEEGLRDPVFRWKDIAAGRFDAPLRRWARAAAAVRSPLLLALGVEVNGSWFPWNASWQGDAAGAAAYRLAYRHVVGLFRAEGARNVTWFFHVDAEGDPDASWNSARAYYPGDDVVDWLGLSVYGAVDRRGPVERFPAKLRHGLADLDRATRAKPIAIVEMGIAESPRWSKPGWIRSAFRALAHSPRVRAVAWWHEDWPDPSGWISTRIDSSRASLATYRREVAGPRYDAAPRFRCVR